MSFKHPIPCASFILENPSDDVDFFKHLILLFVDNITETDEGPILAQLSSLLKTFDLEIDAQFLIKLNLFNSIFSFVSSNQDQIDYAENVSCFLITQSEDLQALFVLSPLFNLFVDVFMKSFPLFSHWISLFSELVPHYSSLLFKNGLFHFIQDSSQSADYSIPFVMKFLSSKRHSSAASFILSNIFNLTDPNFALDSLAHAIYNSANIVDDLIAFKVFHVIFQFLSDERYCLSSLSLLHSIIASGSSSAFRKLLKLYFDFISGLLRCGNEKIVEKTLMILHDLSFFDDFISKSNELIPEFQCIFEEGNFICKEWAAYVLEQIDPIEHANIADCFHSILEE